MEYFERHQGGENAILVHLTLTHLTDPDDLEEFQLLVESAGASQQAIVTGTRSKPDAKYFVGTGKAEEIADLVEQHEADIVIFNHSLTPSQERNLERLVKCRVLDRTGLILDIFAQRARTYEGKLQVELAQLNHLATRLVRGWTHLERQKGGIGLRGPGETQLETDRRLLQVRVNQLKAKLDKVKQTRAQGRAKRQKSDIPTISLVGYTNAGKSTLFNHLANENIYAANQLFATLDPTLRRVKWDGLGSVILVDTVGFVRHLPHELVEAFHATLEETLEADLLLHVIDSSREDMHEQIDAVKSVLSQIDNNVPVLNVFNKIDITDEPPHIGYGEDKQPNRVYLSAKAGLGMDKLTLAVQQLIAGKLQDYQLKITPTLVNSGQLLNSLHELGVIQQLTYDEHGNTLVDVHLANHRLRQLLGQYQIRADNVLTANDVARLIPPLEPFEIAQQAKRNPQNTETLDAEFDLTYDDIFK